MKMSRLPLVLVSMFALSCAESSGPVSVNAEWNLSCPGGRGAGCGALAEQTCLGVVGQRAIAGAHRQPACNGEPIIAICEAVQNADGMRDVFLETEVRGATDAGGDIALQLHATTTDAGDVEPTACNVTIIEDGLPYDVGACGTEEPSMEQPCQLSEVSVEGGNVVFNLECDSLLSSTTGLGFDVGAVGGGPATISFGNCAGFL
jgi:hypothetical protein